MAETGLWAFQVNEIVAAAKYILGSLAIVCGIGLWVHATYFRSDNEAG